MTNRIKASIALVILVVFATFIYLTARRPTIDSTVVSSNIMNDITIHENHLVTISDLNSAKSACGKVCFIKGRIIITGSKAGDYFKTDFGDILVMGEWPEEFRKYSEDHPGGYATIKVILHWHDGNKSKRANNISINENKKPISGFDENFYKDSFLYLHEKQLIYQLPLEE